MNNQYKNTQTLVENGHRGSECVWDQVTTAMTWGQTSGYLCTTARRPNRNTLTLAKWISDPSKPINSNFEVNGERYVVGGIPKLHEDNIHEKDQATKLLLHPDAPL